MSRREQAKAERRQRIIQAARDMIVESGDTAISMRALANRAGVSQATPYNLFGTKRAVLLAVLGDVDTFGDRVASKAGGDPLRVIFDVMDAMADVYAADPAFYRILWQYLFDARGKGEIRGDFELSRRAALLHLVERAAGAAVLDRRIHPEIVARQLEQALFGTAGAWLFDFLAPEHLRPMLGIATGLILAGAAAESSRSRIIERIVRYQRELDQLGLPDSTTATPHTRR